MNTYFASCPRGLESLLADELRGCGALWPEVVGGGVAFRGDWAVCYRANLESRLATRILWLLAEGPYTREEDIYKLALGVPWFQHFPVTRTLRVLTTATNCPLRSIDFVTLRVKDAVCDRFRAHCDERPTVDTREPDVRVHAYLTAERCALYLDTSGAPLWQRGLRLASVDAPLKENLAAGILRLSGWQPDMPLIDPMCGSGTFLLEAVQMALNQAPGLGRSFGFERLSSFQVAEWMAIRQAAEARCQPVRPLPIFGFDRDERAVRATRRNLAGAGWGEIIQVHTGEFLELAPPPETAPTPDAASEGPTGILLANPPYGERIGEAEELAAFYPQLGSALKKHWAGWQVCLFTADLRLPKLVGLKPARKTPLFNGALECRLYAFRMVAGSNRRHPAPEATQPNPAADLAD